MSRTKANISKSVSLALASLRASPKRRDGTLASAELQRNARFMLAAIQAKDWTTADYYARKIAP